MDEDAGEARTEWVTIKYDYLPKYCKECKLQGHDMLECWIIHPKLMDNRSDEIRAVKDEVVHENKHTGKKTGHLMTLSSGKVLGNNVPQWKEVRDRRNQGKEKVAKPGQQIVPAGNKKNGGQSSSGKDISTTGTTNKFAVLEMENSEENAVKQLAVWRNKVSKLHCLARKGQLL